MFKFNLLKDFLVLLVLINSLDFSQGLSDKRLCADPKCQKIISLGTGLINYSAGQKGMISFKISSQIRIFSKSAGSDLSLWGVEVNGRVGYVPRQYIKEEKIFIKDEDLIFIVPVLENGNDVSKQINMQASESIPVLKDNLNPTIPMEENLNSYANANANANTNANATVEPLKMEVTETISPSSTEKSNIGILTNQTTTVSSDIQMNTSEDINNQTINKKAQKDDKNEMDVDYEEEDSNDNHDNDIDNDDEDDEDDDDEDDIIPNLDSIKTPKKLIKISEKIENNLKNQGSNKELFPDSFKANQIPLKSTDETFQKEINSESGENLILTIPKVDDEKFLKDNKEINANVEASESSSTKLSETLSTLLIENSTETFNSSTPSVLKNIEPEPEPEPELNQKFDEKFATEKLKIKEVLNDHLNLPQNIEKINLNLENKNDTIDETTKDDLTNRKIDQSLLKFSDNIPINQENSSTNSKENKTTDTLELQIKETKEIQNMEALPSVEEQASSLKPIEDKKVNITMVSGEQNSFHFENNNSSKSEPITLSQEIINQSKEKFHTEGYLENFKDIKQGNHINELKTNEPSIKISINNEKIEENVADASLEKNLHIELDKSSSSVPQKHFNFPTTDDSDAIPTIDVNVHKTDFQNEQLSSKETIKDSPQVNFKNPSENNLMNIGSSVSNQKIDTLSSQHVFRKPSEAIDDIQTMPSLPSQETPTAVLQNDFKNPAESHDKANQILNSESFISAQEIPFENPSLTVNYEAEGNLYADDNNSLNNSEEEQVYDYNQGTTDDIVKQKLPTQSFKKDTNNVNSDSPSEFTQPTTDIFSDHFITEMPPNAFFDSLTESSRSNSLKDEEKRKEKHSKPSSNIYKSEEYKKHGLFANILETVKNFIPNDNKLSEYIGEKMDNRYCLSSTEPDILTFDGFINAFANKILEMADLVSLLGIVAGTLLCFMIGYYLFCNNNRESNLIAKLNLLERSMLATNKENSILKHDLISTRNKLLSIEDSSFGSNDMVISLKQNLEEKTNEIEKLQEQVSILEKELETATEAGLELNKMVSEMLNNQTGEDTIINSVEELQHQLNEQERTILEINTNLAAKSRENSELQLQIVEQKAQLGHQINVLQNDNDELESEKSALTTRLIELKTAFDLDITRALESKNMEIRRLQSELTAMELKLEDSFNQIQSSEARVNTFEEFITNLKKDSKDNAEELIDFANVKSQLVDMQNKYTSLKESSQDQKEKLAVNEGQIQALSAELEQVKDQFHQSEKDKLEAQTRLEVLSSYFKEKEAQLQKELSQKESMWFKQQGEAVSTVERLTSMQDEIQSLKSQNDALRAEIEAQVAAHKAQIGTLENRAHETWLSARQADRRCEEAKAEAASLRHKLTALTTISKDNPLNIGLPDNSNNSEMKMMPPLGVEPPGSPVLFPLPQFLPPHFMGPPPPGFMSLPPFMTPGDIRPAPLGRIMSPLPQHPNPASRYSDYEADYLPYDDDLDDADDLKRYRINDIPLRHSRYSPPPRTYRSHSPSDSRYDFDISLDCLSNAYDTETNVSPPPSPRRDRSWRSDDYDRHSPPPSSISSAKYERRKNTNSLKKNSSKNDR